MRQTLRWALTIVALSFSQALPAWAQTPKFLGSHRDWAVYEVEDRKGKVCYIASEPAKQDGNFSRRGQPGLLVARWPGDPPRLEVSVNAGYAYRKGSMVEVRVEGRSFELFTDGEHAWSKSDADDQTLINAMRRGATMTVRGTSVRDTFSVDTYSLNGFSAAYQAMQDACGQ